MIGKFRIPNIQNNLRVTLKYKHLNWEPIPKKEEGKFEKTPTTRAVYVTECWAVAALRAVIGLAVLACLFVFLSFCLFVFLSFCLDECWAVAALSFGNSVSG